MLVMRRRQGESILIGEEIEIQILDIGRTRVKIGINAPRQVIISSKEAVLVRDENLIAGRAGSRQALEAALEHFLKAGAKSSPPGQNDAGE